MPDPESPRGRLYVLLTRCIDDLEAERDEAARFRLAAWPPEPVDGVPALVFRAAGRGVRIARAHLARGDRDTAQYALLRARALLSR